MPITENGYEYEIPEEIKQLITKKFMIDFRDCLDEIWDNKGKTVYNCYLFIGGTVGWSRAFTKACEQNNLNELKKYYDTLEWYDSDLFDDKLCDIMVANEVIVEGEPEDWDEPEDEEVENYEIPEEIKELITDDFIVVFSKQLDEVFNYRKDTPRTYHELGFYIDHTNQWYNAFYRACKEYNKELFDYWHGLEWYDSDIFDSILSEMVLEYNTRKAKEAGIEFDPYQEADFIEMKKCLHESKDFKCTVVKCCYDNIFNRVVNFETMENDANEKILG